MQHKVTSKGGNKQVVLKVLIYQFIISKEKKKILKKILIPRWDKALDSFIKSAKKYKNPVSAFEGLYIISSYYSKLSQG